MSKSNLILIGAGGHSRSCIDVIEQDGRYGIGGLVGLSQEVGSKLFGYEVLTTDSGLGELSREFPYALIAVGQIQTSELRVRLYEKSILAGFNFPTIIAKSAYVSPRASIGAGTIVMHGAVVNAGATIGRNCIINSCALIEHDSHVSDHCHVSTGAILNGGTSIGTGSFIGSGAVIKEGVSIGKNALVGMGLIIRKNIENNTEFRGLAQS
jgi:sugar O-acyltransferase (sialic acid O-acetyltransferase NeuD family)